MFFFALPVVRPVSIFALHGTGIAIDDGAKYGEEGSAACVALYASSSHYVARCLAILKLLSHSQILVSENENSEFIHSFIHHFIHSFLPFTPASPN